MKKLSESVGFLVGICGIAGIAATVAYFAWDQRNLGASNTSLSKENALYRSTIKDLESAIARLEGERGTNKTAGVKPLSPKGENTELPTQDGKMKRPVTAHNSAPLAQITPSAGRERDEYIKTKGAFRFESVGCRVVTGKLQCGVMVSNTTDLERSLIIRAGNAAMTDISDDSYRASAAQFRGESSSYLHHTMSTTSNDKAIWIFEGLPPGTVPAKLSFTVSDQYKENGRMQNREIYEELEMWIVE